MTIKAMETHSPGYRFRSRLEARWAVFFDALGVQWEYEPEGYDLGDAGWYLPDFWLPDNEWFIEVKGKEVTHEEKMKAHMLAVHSGYPVVIAGQMSEKNYIGDGYGTYHGYTPNALCFVGYQIPPWDMHVLQQFRIDFWTVTFPAFLSHHFSGNEIPHPLICNTKEGIRKYISSVIELDRRYYKNKYGKEHPKWKYGISSGDGITMKPNGVIALSDGYRPELEVDFCFCGIDNKTLQAYDAARSARFEHK